MSTLPNLSDASLLIMTAITQSAEYPQSGIHAIAGAVRTFGIHSNQIACEEVRQHSLRLFLKKLIIGFGSACYSPNIARRWVLSADRHAPHPSQ